MCHTLCHYSFHVLDASCYGLLTLNTVGDENFALNEYIYVNNGKAAGGGLDMDDQQFWVARVLEIRAVDEAHVYLRVYWLYWPEELPDGRQPYHGQKELVASNHMDIIDAMTVSGRAHVKHWMELDEDEELPELYWRQKFDYPSRTLMVCPCYPSFKARTNLGLVGNTRKYENTVNATATIIRTN